MMYSSGRTGLRSGNTPCHASHPSAPAPSAREAYLMRSRTMGCHRAILVRHTAMLAAHGFQAGVRGHPIDAFDGVEHDGAIVQRGDDVVDPRGEHQRRVVRRHLQRLAAVENLHTRLSDDDHCQVFDGVPMTRHLLSPIEVVDRAGGAAPLEGLRSHVLFVLNTMVARVIVAALETLKEIQSSGINTVEVHPDTAVNALN